MQDVALVAAELGEQRVVHRLDVALLGHDSNSRSSGGKRSGRRSRWIAYDRREDVLAARLREVVAIDADGGAVRARGERARPDVEMIDRALRLDDLLKDVRGCAAGHVLVHDEERAGLLDRLDDRVTDVERAEASERR